MTERNLVQVSGTIQPKQSYSSSLSKLIQANIPDYDQVAARENPL